MRSKDECEGTTCHFASSCKRCSRETTVPVMIFEIICRASEDRRRVNPVMKVRGNEARLMETDCSFMEFDDCSKNPGVSMNSPPWRLPNGVDVQPKLEGRELIIHSGTIRSESIDPNH